MSRTFDNGCAYIDGRYVPLEEAAIPIVDWGFLRGDCVYDAIPFTKGFLFRLQDHLERFRESMATWRLTCPLNQSDVHRICHEMIAKSRLRDGLLLIITTRGLPPSLEIRDPALFESRFYAFAQVLPPIASPEQLESGLRIIVSKVPRVPQQSINSTAKNFQWGDLMMARLEAHDADVDNAVLLDYDGNLAEGPGFNVFVVENGVLSTPSHHCLYGITRRTVLEIARSQGMTTKERDIPVAELFEADEVLFTTSAGGIFPVAEVNGQPVGKRRVGPVTSEIRREYWRRRTDPMYCESVAYND